MIDFYYQIKGKKGDEQTSLSYWVFPPIMVGKVTAKNKKEAKEIINDEHNKKFPGRVLFEELDKNEFLLSIEEIKPDSHISRLFELQSCLRCGKGFYIVDKYNDLNCKDKGSEYCSYECKDEQRQNEYLKNVNLFLEYKNIPVIYKITNKKTGMIYIGKTVQVFTLRWYQHFFQTGDSKFHTAIKESSISDWNFEIQEVINYPNLLNTSSREFYEEREKYTIERERYWIDHFNTIKEGYNSI